MTSESLTLAFFCHGLLFCLLFILLLIFLIVLLGVCLGCLVFLHGGAILFHFGCKLFLVRLFLSIRQCFPLGSCCFCNVRDRVTACRQRLGNLRTVLGEIDAI